MAMTSDIQSTCLSANGYISQGPGRVLTIVIHSQTAGLMSLKDGGSGGTAKITIGYDSNATVAIPIGGEGVRFTTDIYLTATNIDRITVFWG